jgi:type IV pilus assembly protein PilE
MRIDMMTLRKNTAGLTLIELMITLAIIAIIAGIAFPIFQQTQARSRTPTAIAFLTQAQNFMDRCYNRNTPYTFVGCVLPPAIATPAPPNNFYTLAVAVTPATFILAVQVTPDTYILTATAVPGQPTDPNCARLTLDNTGLKGSFDAGNPPILPAASAGCWPQ